MENNMDPASCCELLSCFEWLALKKKQGKQHVPTYYSPFPCDWGSKPVQSVGMLVLQASSEFVKGEQTATVNLIKSKIEINIPCAHFYLHL